MLATLSMMYDKPSAANKVHLMRSRFSLRMGEGTTVANHLSEFNMTITKLDLVEIKFDDEVQALILLSSLPESWSGTVTALSASARKEKLRFDDVRDLIISEEIRRKESGSTFGSVLNAGNRRMSHSRSTGNHGRSKSKGNPHKDKSKIKCRNCNKNGHYKNECKAAKDKTSDDHRDVLIVSDSTTETATQALVLSMNSPLESWVLDCGGFFHSCSSTNLMEHYTSGNFIKVYLANDELLKIVGKGDVWVKSANGSVIMHISRLKRNLLSVGQMDK
ncbi:hypothetical protein V2J09_022451 [Rumex salicifolius]